MGSISGLLRLRALSVCHAGVDGTAGLAAPPLAPLTNGLDGLGVVFLLLEGEFRAVGFSRCLRKSSLLSDGMYLGVCTAAGFILWARDLR